MLKPRALFLVPLLSAYTLVSSLAGPGFTALCLCDDGICVVSLHGISTDRCCPPTDGYCHPLLGSFGDAAESEGSCEHCTNLPLIRDANRGTGVVTTAVPAPDSPSLACHNEDQVILGRLRTSPNEVSVDGSPPCPLCGTVILLC